MNIIYRALVNLSDGMMKRYHEVMNQNFKLETKVINAENNIASVEETALSAYLQAEENATMIELNSTQE